MIRYSKKISFLKVFENWFDYQPKWTDWLSLYAIYHVKSGKKFSGVRCDSHTLEISLEKSEEDIFNGFNKNMRQDFRKAEAEGITIDEQVNLEEFVAFFNEFAQLKGTFGTSLENIQEKGNNLKCYFSRYQGQIVSAHSYLLDEQFKIVRHFQTASRRFDEVIDKNLAGRGNKYLLMKSILRFKEMGYKTFDFGGYALDTTDPVLAGINEYKRKFGGEVTTCIDYYSYPYWLFKKVSKIIGRKGATV
jgi:hypothetical protein